MGFYDQMRRALNRVENVSVTENGAVGYKSTGKALLDMNFAVFSMRSMGEEEIIDMFAMAWDENPELALRWLFFLRDVRGGLGERRSFRVIFGWLLKHHRTEARALLHKTINGEYLIPFYGRWDDLLAFYEDCPNDVLLIIADQLRADIARMRRGESVSLLAKWLPSINTSSVRTVDFAKKIAHGLSKTPREYRKMLSDLRKHIDVVEKKMSAGQWDQVDYEKVPSKANVNYNDAFLRHDEDRRREYLGRVLKGGAKINASVLYPYEIYSRIARVVKGLPAINDDVDIAAFEAMWRSLVDKAQINKNVIVVADGSGSMYKYVPLSSSVMCYHVAYSLALYFAELLSGEFHGKFITFSEHPRLVDVGRYDSLVDKIEETFKYGEVANTNIEAVFDLILQTALDNHVAPQDMPDTVLIISDMEFDNCATANAGGRISDFLFNMIGKEYRDHGYELPRLIFWNVNSRTRTIPVTENKLGVALVSGFSSNNIDMVMSSELDPYKCLMETLCKERYDPVVQDLYLSEI